MGGKRYRLSVYLVIGLCMVLSQALIGGFGRVPLAIGMYLPVIVLTEWGLVRVTSRHGGVENARRKGFRERLVVYAVLALCWVLVALLLGWVDLIPIILVLLLPLITLFDLVLIYRVLSTHREKLGGTGSV